MSLEKIVHTHDGWRVTEAGKRPAFRRKSFTPPEKIFRCFGRPRHQLRGALTDRERTRQVFFDRDLTVELGIPRAVSNAKAALSQYRDDFVPTDTFARTQSDKIGNLRPQPLLVVCADYHATATAGN